MSYAQTVPLDARAPDRERESPGPEVPESVADTGLTEESIVELLFKMLFVQGASTGERLADLVCLPFHLVDDLLLSLQHRRLVEVLRTEGHGRAAYVYDLSEAGRERARNALEASKYVGPAPVPLEQYREWVRRQSVRDVRVSREHVGPNFSDLVLSREVLEALGPALNGGRSLFLHGEPGNGKTAIAERINKLVGGSIFVPYAVDIGGETMVVYDPVHHRPDGDGPGRTKLSTGLVREIAEFDTRFVRVRRPTVFVGGELTLDQLDLQYDPFTKFYQAPFQVKAAGGVLIIDDFGRQRVRPADLLNRWIVPLEKEVDFLSLHTGVKFPIPFDTLLVFATNLNPDDLVDEAFLRRIHYKIHVGSPARLEYERIFRAECEKRDIAYDDRAVERIYRRFYEGHGIPPRGCHPRDIVGHLEAVALYEGSPVELRPEYLDRACGAYFLVMNRTALEGGTPEKSHDAS